MFGFSKKEEAEAESRSIEDPRVPISNANIISFLGLGSETAAGEPVTLEAALGVPAIWAAVNFIAGTMAGLPLHVYRRTRGGRERVTGRLATMLHDAVNDETTSFEWRKHIMECALTGGRGISYIERGPTGAVENIWPIDPNNVTVIRKDGRKIYQSRDGKSVKTYAANEIIDLPYMLATDRLRAHSPIMTNREAVGMAIGVTKYGGRFFANGGVPPFAITGPFQSPGAMQRAVEDLEAAVKKSAKDGRQALAVPLGHEIKQIGSDPNKSQMIESQRFVVEQISRIYSLPPTFLQDLTHGTFSNTEQQDLHFVKHTLKRWVEQFEQELNLKLFGRNSTTRFVEFNVDGLLRGDFKTRMDGYAQAVQNAIMKPSEIRERENLPATDGADVLLVQGATVPIGQQPMEQPAEGDE